ncbi:unnamed protein product [Rotaria sp. Silwood1]|nr:unnamed protein product [Rotaria sp. Silwood1]CAF1691810.1 unnamed protein product [Rotaria sp. Silwood1]
MAFMFTSGVPLEKTDNKNDSKPHRFVHHNESDLDELLKVVNEAGQDHEDFHKVLRKRATFTAEQRQFQNDVLYAHNYYRAYHCAQSLQLDDLLSTSAQNFAQKLADTNQFYHSGTKGVGENLYMATSSNGIKLHGYTGVISWYNEIRSYNFNNGGFSMATGHFTQLVWRSSTKLGVGIAYGNGGRSAYLVAQYTPPGNYIGQFQTNVLAHGSC